MKPKRRVVYGASLALVSEGGRFTCYPEGRHFTEHETRNKGAQRVGTKRRPHLMDLFEGT